MLEELDHLMELSISPMDALARYTDVEAVNDRITEWFETPMGSISDISSWGNTLYDFAHEPLSAQLEVTMEAVIVKKLSYDCNLTISGIRVDFLDIDRCRVRILYDGGMFDGKVDRNAIQ